MQLTRSTGTPPPNRLSTFPPASHPVSSPPRLPQQSGGTQTAARDAGARDANFANDRTISQPGRSRNPMTAKQEARLQRLRASPDFQSFNSMVRGRITGLYAELAGTAPHTAGAPDGRDNNKQLDRLVELIHNKGFQGLDDQDQEMSVLDGWQHDPAFSSNVDKLVANKTIGEQDQKTALDHMQHVKEYEELYKEADEKNKQTIMDNVYAAVTSKRFFTMNAVRKTDVIKYLVESGDRQYALQEGGAQKALNQADRCMAEPSTDAFSVPLPQTFGIPIKPPATATPLAGGTAPGRPSTPQSVAVDIKNAANGADGFANNDENINHDLLRDARTDPVTFAYKKLALDHKDDPAYLAHLNQCIDRCRLDYTTQQVKALHDQGHDADFEVEIYGKKITCPGALTVLKTNMAAAPDAAARQTIFDQAGAGIYTRNFLSEQLDRAIAADRGSSGWLESARNALTSDSSDSAHCVQDLLRMYGENAPPEVNNTLTDLVADRLEDPDSEFVSLVRDDASGENQGGIYRGLSAVVGSADTHGGHLVGDKVVPRSPEIAGLLMKNVYTGDAGDYRSRTVHSDIRAPYYYKTGFHAGIEQAVGEGNAGLSIALINQYDDSTALGQDLIDYFGRGVKALNDNTQKVYDAWGGPEGSNAQYLDFMQTVGKLDPDQALTVIAGDRAGNPEDARQIDEHMEAIYRQGVKVFRFNQDVQNLRLDLTAKGAPGAVENVQSEIARLDAKHNALVQFMLQPGVTAPGQKVALNPLLQDYFNGQLDFGAVESPASRLLYGIENHRRQVFDWLETNKDRIPPATAKAIQDHTNAYMAKAQAIVTAAPDNAGDLMQQATDAYVAQYTADLESSPVQPDLESPPQQVQARLRDGWHAWQKQLTVLRLTRNVVESVGPLLAHGYMSRTWAMNAIGRGFERSIAARGTGPNPAGGGRHAANHLPGALYRPFRALGLVAFAEGGVVLGFGTKPDHSDGSFYDGKITSDDLFAAAFAVGVATEGYRLRTGKALGPGKDRTDRWGSTFAGDMARTGAGLLTSAFIAGGDTKWMSEDWYDWNVAGRPFDLKDPKVGNVIATTLLAGADWVELGNAVMPTVGKGLAGRRLISASTARLLGVVVESSGTARFAGYVPVVGRWVAAIQLAGQTLRYVSSVKGEKDKYEFRNDPRYAAMVGKMGFTADQAKELMNRNEGGAEYDDWYDRVNPVRWGQSAYAFFTEGGVSPMHVLNGMWDRYHVPAPQRLQYLQSLTPDEMHDLVSICHAQLDDHMDDQGRIDPQYYQEVRSEMDARGLWKDAYLGDFEASS